MNDSNYLDELLGAYALNAVDAAERDEIERYLEASPRAAAEVAGHLSVAAALAGSTSEASAPSWERISAAIDAAPAPGRSSDQDPTRPAPLNIVEHRAEPLPHAPIQLADHRDRIANRRSRKTSWFAAAAASLAITGLGVQTFRQETRLRDLRTELAIEQQSVAEARSEVKRLADRDQFNVETVLAAPGARVAPLTDGGKAIGRVLLDPNGRGFLVLSSDTTLEAGKAYQLWGVQNDAVISLGVMQPGVAAMPLSAAGDWAQFVLTVESLPGVVTSKGPAVAAGTFAS
jgi:anti-sigma-K factor RskA